MSRRFALCAVAVTVTLLASILFIRASASGQEKLRSQNRLIVHEWGTMTSVMGEDGIAVSWKPLIAPSDLPDFVYGISPSRDKLGPLHDYYVRKASLSGTVRMETPVVYFYADHPTTASLSVDFPEGNLTEWYPQGDRERTPLDWTNFGIMPHTVPDLPADKNKQAESRYYAARATDSAPLRVIGPDGRQDEKFLFYRGVGTFDLPLTVNLSASLVLVGSRGAQAPPQAILFENLNGNVRYQIQDLVGNQTVFDRLAPGNSVASLRGDLLKMLVANGLYPKEAQAMIDTWGDQWFEEGLRVFYLMPRKITDSVIPMTVHPSPTEIVRLLVCRAEVITPEVEAAVREQVVNLGDSSPEVRSAAAKTLHERPRFLQPILERIQEKTDDPAIKSRINDLLATQPAQPSNG
jgi:hypothetical protein